jgi:LPXTG-motif cell wall-anchored protein
MRRSAALVHHVGDLVNQRFRRLTVLAVAMLTTMALAAPAFAQYPPSSAYGVACTVSGNEVACAVTGAVAGEQLAVTATCDGTVAYEQTLTADEDGEATFGFSASNADDCSVQVLGAQSGATTTSVSVSDDDDDGTPVAAPATGDRLPFTGSEVLPLLALGLVLVAGGAFAIRRRGNAGA